MSLVYFQPGSRDQDVVLPMIKEKTGLEIEVVSTSSYGIWTCNVKFPDMDEAVSLNIRSTSYYDTVSGGTVFVDTEKHFFAWVGKDTTKTLSSVYLTKWLSIMVFELDGVLTSAFPTKDDRYFYEAMNIPKYAKNDGIKNQITVLPAFISIETGSTNYPCCYVPNLYINYERTFETGLKFVDENGNEFVTLGSYLLYYNGNINQK